MDAPLRLRPSLLSARPGAALPRDTERATAMLVRLGCDLALSIVSVSLLAVQSLSDISPLFLTGLLEAVVSALFMNIYIVGLNQLFDIEIDKSFALGWAVGSQPLFWALFISFVLGTAYSINDIPDIEGDRIFGIRSFSVRLGQKKVFWICVGLLEMAYTVAILMGATSTSLWSKTLTIVGHSILAAILWSSAQSVDLTSKAAITSFYMFIWKLFYAEYLLIPLVR
ncbi:putative homogentisate phytyltransferase 1, chloroplastic [Dichanthelium oligosanthes]|uniref:Putative homogentisate phytyltransferase 1, chloroplastic n=1 Tax=Dichanthelium oligosanthes TaxID=888268 RepID=A0A1E5VVI6_9POAL|nr:putative homogentisate phytyltransferase 1, chloroplastic [Dichanthelium oligosanthes]